jgi:hypothetical protein
MQKINHKLNTDTPEAFDSSAEGFGIGQRGGLLSASRRW